MSNQFIISLKKIGEKEVHLDSMSSEELASFIEVMSSLKSIAMSMKKSDKITFSIQECCAAFATQSQDEQPLSEMHDEIELAMKGESTNDIVLSGLRVIKKQFKRNEFDYDFYFLPKKGDQRIYLHDKLKTSKRLLAKSVETEYRHELKSVSGRLTAIGGVSPNYHLDFALGEKLTVTCTEEEAMRINQYLYKPFLPVIILCTIAKKPNKDDYYTYKHKAITDKTLLDIFHNYLTEYNKKGINIIEKLTITHDFVDRNFYEAKRNGGTLRGHIVLNNLLMIFNDVDFHLSELKTLLVISKPFKEHEIIKKSRASLLETLNMRLDNLMKKSDDKSKNGNIKKE